MIGQRMFVHAYPVGTLIRHRRHFGKLWKAIAHAAFLRGPSLRLWTPYALMAVADTVISWCANRIGRVQTMYSTCAWIASPTQDA